MDRQLGCRSLQQIRFMLILAGGGLLRPLVTEQQTGDGTVGCAEQQEYDVSHQ